MTQALKDTLTELLGSKKFLILLATLVAAAAARFGLNVSPDAIVPYLGLAATAILAQGIADHGKGAAEVATKTPQFGELAHGKLLETEPTPATKQAGFVSVCLLWGIACLGLAAYAFAFVTSCTAAQKAAAKTLATCSEGALEKALEPTVLSILENGPPDGAASWNVQLAALAAQFAPGEIDCVVTFVKAVMVGKVGGATDNSAAISRADEWLKHGK